LSRANDSREVIDFAGRKEKSQGMRLRAFDAFVYCTVRMLLQRHDGLPGAFFKFVSWISIFKLEERHCAGYKVVPPSYKLVYKPINYI